MQRHIFYPSLKPCDPEGTPTIGASVANAFRIWIASFLRLAIILSLERSFLLHQGLEYMPLAWLDCAFVRSWHDRACSCYLDSANFTAYRTALGRSWKIPGMLVIVKRRRPTQFSSGQVRLNKRTCAWGQQEPRFFPKVTPGSHHITNSQCFRCIPE